MSGNAKLLDVKFELKYSLKISAISNGLSTTELL